MPETAVAPMHRPSAIAKMAARLEVDPDKLLATLKATAFKPQANEPEVSNEQLMALLVVANQYGLNPFTRELFAFNDRHRGIIPIVSVDGWSRIVNEHAQFDGLEFSYGPSSTLPKVKGAPEWIACTIFRKDRSHPTTIREQLAECFRETGPWLSHPGRMLRHKAFIQCARAAFGFAGIYDEDEGRGIIEGGTIERQSATIANLNASIQPDTKSRAVLAGPEDPPPVFTFAQVAAAIAQAPDADVLDLARDMIEHVANEQHRAELDVLERDKRKTLAAK